MSEVEKRRTVHEMLTTLPEYQGLTQFPFDPHGWVDSSSHLMEILCDVHPKHVVEVGVWMGLTTKYFCDQPSVVDVTCVDHWDAQLIDPNSIDMTKQPRNRVNTMYEQFLANCYGYDIWKKVYPVRLTSLEGAKYCSALGLQFDLVWVDADHSTKSTCEDIEAWMPLVAPGGIMCGDDWYFFSEPYSVRTAVVDSAAKFGLTGHFKGNIWWYTK